MCAIFWDRRIYLKICWWPMRVGNPCISCGQCCHSACVNYSSQLQHFDIPCSNIPLAPRNVSAIFMWMYCALFCLSSLCLSTIVFRIPWILLFDCILPIRQWARSGKNRIYGWLHPAFCSSLSKHWLDLRVCCTPMSTMNLGPVPMETP